MALTPLQIELIDDTGAPVSGATIELRHELTAASADGYNRDGTTMTQPFLTDVTGSKLVWLVNGVYEWRSTGAWTTDWKAFRAWGGYGVEGIFSSNPTPDVALDDPVPAVGSDTVLDTIAVPSFGVETTVGAVRVTVDFAFDHMRDLALSLLPPSGAAALLSVWDGDRVDPAGDYAFDGQVTFAAEGPDRYMDDLGNLVVMVDGGTYGSFVFGSIVRGEMATGDWSLTWRAPHDPQDFVTHTGVLRSWTLELLPA